MNIAISGDIGSGKSTICKMFQEEGYALYQAGDVYRRMADELGMSVHEFHAYAAQHPEIDKTINADLVAFCKMCDNVVLDSRLAFRLVPDVYSVYLECDPKIGAAMVFGDKRKAEQYTSIVQCFYDIQKRKETEIKRFNEMLGCDITAADNYNLKVNVSMATPEQVVGVIKMMTKEHGTENRGHYIPSLHSACFSDEYKEKIKEIHTLTDVLAPYPYLQSTMMQTLLTIIDRYDHMQEKLPNVYLCECPEWLEAIRFIDERINVCTTTRDSVGKCLADGHVVCWRGKCLWVGEEADIVPLEEVLDTCDVLKKMAESEEE